MAQGRGWHVARLMSWDGQVYFRGAAAAPDRTWRYGTRRGHEAVGSLGSRGRGIGSYSTEVPQPVRTRADLRARSGTVTCGLALLWTVCRLMVRRRSTVRFRKGAPHKVFQVRGQLWTPRVDF